MVGSGATDRSKEAVGMMALHEALRNVCLNSDWNYSIFWTIRPRPRVRGGNGCKAGDDNGSLMLMWEDGFCRGRVTLCLGENHEMDGEDPVRKAFSKMSIQLYNYGEGLMGKVASDKCHKWAFKEPTECEPNISNYWQSSFDALPTEWTEQFESGIQTIAVIQAGHGLLQLGSCKIIPEDLHFVLRMRHTFESLGYQSGLYLSQLFSSSRSSSSSSTVPLKQPVMPIHHPFSVFNSGTRPIHPAVSMLTSPNIQNTAGVRIPPPNHSSDVTGDGENDIKWPNGFTFVNAFGGQTDEAKLLFNPEVFVNEHDHQNPNLDSLNLHNSGNANLNELLSLDNHPKMDNNFEGIFTLPARITTPPSSTSLDHHSQNPGEFRNEAGMYSDVMETFLE